jgi:DNA-3-methyladenine glycosylase
VNRRVPAPPRRAALAPLPPSFYRRPAEEVARDLLGRYLVRFAVEGPRAAASPAAADPPPSRVQEKPDDASAARDDASDTHAAAAGGRPLILRLVEVEAYLGAPDRASHAWGGRRTPRNASLYLPGGHAYVYFIYGMHWCLNAVTGDEGVGSAVLLRAGEPVVGEEWMRANRGLPAAGSGMPVRPGDVAGGPGKLCRALAVDRAFDGLRLDGGPLQLAAGEPAAAAQVVSGPRIGVAYAGEAAAWPLRFAIAGNPHVSRPRPG